MPSYVDYESHLADLERSMDPEEQRNYDVCKSVIRKYIKEKNLHRMSSYVDYFNYYKPLHRVVNLHQEKFGDTPESDRADSIIHSAIYGDSKDAQAIAGKSGEMLDYLKTQGGFEDMSDRLQLWRYIGRMGRHRKFEPLSWREKLGRLAGDFHKREFYSGLFEWFGNYVRYQLSVKEIRNMRLLAREKGDGLLDIVAWYDIEKGDGSIVQTLSIFRDEKEKGVLFSVPGTTYGLDNVITKKEVAAVAGTVLTTYVVKQIPVLSEMISKYPTLDWLARTLSLYSSPTEGIALIAAGLAAKKLMGVYDNLKEKRGFVKAFVKSRDTDDMLIVSNEVAEYDCVKANICYAILWNRSLSEDMLYRVAERYRLDRKDVRRYLDIFGRELNILDRRTSVVDDKVMEKYAAKKGLENVSYSYQDKESVTGDRELEDLVGRLEKDLYEEK